MAASSAVDSQLLELPHASEAGRLVRVRVERPARGAGPWPAVLLMHGFKGFMHWGFFPELSRRLASAGTIAVSLNASGSGIGPDLQSFTEDEAFAHNTYSRELEDLDAVRAHVLARVEGVDRGRLGLFGHSRGGGMVLLHAARHGDYRAVVTWAAIDDVDRFDDAAKAEWRERGFVSIPNARTGQVHRLELDVLRDVEAHREALDVLAACRALRSPALVVHGGEDTAVDPAAAERILAALPDGLGQRLVVPGAGHTFGARHPLEEIPEDLERVLGATLEHFARHLGDPS